MNANLCINVLDLLGGLEIAAILWLYEEYHGKTPKWVTKVVQSIKLPRLIGDGHGLPYYVSKEVHIKTNDPAKTLSMMLSDFRLRQYNMTFKTFKRDGIVCLSLSCNNSEDLQDVLQEITNQKVIIKWYPIAFDFRARYPMPSWY